MDYAGPMQGKMFLIAVDAHSKWMEVAIVQSATSAATIEKAQKPHGLPEMLVLDNGTCFTSQEFKEFMEFNMSRRPPITLPQMDKQRGRYKSSKKG